MGIVVIGAVFVDIKGYPDSLFVPGGRNAGRVEQVHGGVGRNVAEDIANCELRPTFVSLIDSTGIGADVLRKLKSHKVVTRYIRETPDGIGTWLAVFNNGGDVVASISKRPDLSKITDILDEQGDEIFSEADSVILEIDIDKDIVKRVFKLAKKYNRKVFAMVSNMNIALERRDFLMSVDCFICNQQEAGILFASDYANCSPMQLAEIISQKAQAARINSMIVTMGDKGAVYTDSVGNYGHCPARTVHIIDTTGAGDAFCAGASIGLTYGKNLAEACQIGTLLASTVIATSENVCPRFQPMELGLNFLPSPDEIR